MRKSTVFIILIGCFVGWWISPSRAHAVPTHGESHRIERATGTGNGVTYCETHHRITILDLRNGAAWTLKDLRIRHGNSRLTGRLRLTESADRQTTYPRRVMDCFVTTVTRSGATYRAMILTTRSGEEWELRAPRLGARH